MLKRVLRIGAAGLLTGVTLLPFASTRIATTQPAEASGIISIPGSLEHLATDPVGLAVFGSSLVFPQFMIDGHDSSVAVFDTNSGTLAKYRVPSRAQGQFAYAVAPDLAHRVLWIGARDVLVRFDVETHAIQVIDLPAVAYPYVQAGDLGGPNVLGLTVDKAGAVWMTRDHDSGITRLDPSSLTFTEFPVPAGIVPGAVAAMDDGLIAAQVYHVNNPAYELDGANMDTGYLLVNVRIGTARFVKQMTTDVLRGASGHLLVAGSDRAEELDGEGRNSLASYPLTGRSIHPGLAVSPVDGSVWSTTGADVTQTRTDGSVSRFAPPQKCGGNAPIPAGIPKSAGDTCLYPGVSSIMVDSHGTAWAVIAGYNAIGRAVE